MGGHQTYCPNWDSLEQGGEPFPARGLLDIYNSTRGPCQTITLHISLLDFVKHLIGSPLLPWEGLTKYSLQATRSPLQLRA